MPNKKDVQSTAAQETEALRKRVDAMMDPNQPDGSIKTPSAAKPLKIELKPDKPAEATVETAPAVPNKLLKKIEPIEPVSPVKAPKPPAKAETKPEPVPEPETPVEKTDLPPATETPAESTPLDDTETDQAVDDIAAKDSDAILEAEDAARRAAESSSQANGSKAGWVWPLLAIILLVILVFLAILYVKGPAGTTKLF